MGGGSELLSAISALPSAVDRNTKKIGRQVEVIFTRIRGGVAV